MQLLLVAPLPNYTVLFKNLEAFLCVKYHLSSPSGTYLSANPRWLFWGRGSENHTF